MKVGIICDLAEWEKSGIYHGDLLGRVRKKSKTTQYLFHGHKGESDKEVRCCKALDRIKEFLSGGNVAACKSRNVWF